MLKFSDLYHTRDLPENIKEEEGIQMAIDSMRQAYAQDEIRAVIEAVEKAERDRFSELSAAREQGLQEGIEEGRQAGIQQGREAGIEEGRKQISREMARKMLHLGIDLSTVADTTGLSHEELKSLVE